MTASRPRRGATAEHGKTGSRRGTRSRSSSEPSLAGLPMLRNSERSTLKKCEFAWHLAYQRKLKPLTEAPALRFGSLIHGALAAYYPPGVKRGESPATAFERLYQADLKQNSELFGMRLEEEERWVNAAELGPAMMDNYVDEYGKDSDWEVIATELPFETVVYKPTTGEPWFLYVGVIDGLWRHRVSKEFWVPDHKTTAGIGDKNWKHLTIDDQAGGYWSYGVDFLITQGLLRDNPSIQGMLYNVMRKALPDERASKLMGGQRLYLNLDGTVSKKQPSPYFKRIKVYRDEFDKNEARRRAMVDWRRLELFRSGELELSKSPGQFTCNSCAVRDACEVHETGGDMEAFIKATMKTWDPYAEHEIYDGR